VASLVGQRTKEPGRIDPADGHSTPQFLREWKINLAFLVCWRTSFREQDYPTQVHLQWFIAERVEEEKVARDIVEQLKMIGERSNALLLLDRELAKRESGMVNESRGLIAEPSL
jgi:hypothetical protein